MSKDALFSSGRLAAESSAMRRRQNLIIPGRLSRAVTQVPLDSAARERSYQIIRRWGELESSGKLRQLSETQLQAEFLTQVFGQALGYALVSDHAEHYELQPQLAVNGGVADAALGRFAGEAREPRVLIELKGPTVDVDRPAGCGRTPVQQLWDYLNLCPQCRWGIVCNYVSFRLYHRDHTPRAFELFTLEELSRNRQRFDEFYVLFSRDGLLPPRADREPHADRLLRETGERQREVGDELYERYSSQRRDLIHHLHARLKQPLPEAIRIAQRLIDRIVFIAFCQSRDLIAQRTLQKAHASIPLYQRATNPRWKNFLNLFRAVDVGHGDLGIPHGYNGNLFKPDETIDNLELDDSWTDFFRDIGEYDFQAEVNVDVLGNLFERSVTELERLRVGGFFQGEDADGAGARMPKSAQRKRFGIYYTPPEFTRFLVQQTAGTLIDERCAALAAELNVEPDAPTPPRARKAIIEFVQRCLQAVRDLKIVDPACGSGAFLIAAYDLLEDRYFDLIERLDRLGQPADEVAALRAQVSDFILKDNLFGVDLSPEAVEITQLALWIRSARRGRTLADLSQHVLCGNSLVDDPHVDPVAFDWRHRFAAIFERDAGGFDCVIGNPPWERLKLQEREFFSLAAPEIASCVSAAQRRAMIAKLEGENRPLFERYQSAKQQADRALMYARDAGRFPLTGHGDVNTYMLFAEAARAIVAPQGMVGLLVPSGIATDETTKDYFAALVESGALKLMYDFENRRRAFPDVDNRFKFCTLVFGGAARRHDSADFVFFAHQMEDLEPKKRHIPLSAADLRLLNPNTRTCPIFRSRRDADLTRSIYRNVPILVDRTRRSGGNPWGVRFVRMFDQTNDAELFHTRAQLEELGLKPDGNRWKKGRQRFLPLYEAKMIQAYDHRAASVVLEEGNWVRQGQTAPTSLVQHQNPEFTVEPRWWVEKGEVARLLGVEAPPALLAYKDVTSATNQRTMIAALVPLSAVVNSAPLILPDDRIAPRPACCLLANLNSHVYDFVARQKVGGVHLNFFIVEQLPTLPPDRYAERCPWNKRQTLERWVSDRVLRLTCTANDMIPLAKAAGFEPEVHKWRPEERATLRAELDAAYFHLYRLERSDVEYVLSTFQGLREDGPTRVGESTSEQILACYERLAEAAR